MSSRHYEFDLNSPPPQRKQETGSPRKGLDGETSSSPRQPAEKRKRQKSAETHGDPLKPNSGIVDTMTQSNYSGYFLSQPIKAPVWRGWFNCMGSIYGKMSGHLSNKACPRVIKESNKLHGFIDFEKLPKSVVWPRSFATAPPTDDNIGLFFFPDSLDDEPRFNDLVDEMSSKEMVLRAMVGRVELLLFSSLELPENYWRFAGMCYLWGIFKRRESTIPQQSQVVNLISDDEDPVGTDPDGPYGCSSLAIQPAFDPSMGEEQRNSSAFPSIGEEQGNPSDLSTMIRENQRNPCSLTTTGVERGNPAALPSIRQNQRNPCATRSSTGFSRSAFRFYSRSSASAVNTPTPAGLVIGHSRPLEPRTLKFHDGPTVPGMQRMPFQCGQTVPKREHSPVHADPREPGRDKMQLHHGGETLREIRGKLPIQYGDPTEVARDRLVLHNGGATLREIRGKLPLQNGEPSDQEMYRLLLQLHADRTARERYRLLQLQGDPRVRERGRLRSDGDPTTTRRREKLPLVADPSSCRSDRSTHHGGPTLREIDRIPLQGDPAVAEEIQRRFPLRSNPTARDRESLRVQHGGPTVLETEGLRLQSGGPTMQETERLRLRGDRTLCTREILRLLQQGALTVPETEGLLFQGDPAERVRHRAGDPTVPETERLSLQGDPTALEREGLPDHGGRTVRERGRMLPNRGRRRATAARERSALPSSGVSTDLVLFPLAPEGIGAQSEVREPDGSRHKRTR
ncbi:hypothetical protein H6P81_015909 [Aristolochia fimbriata]|uniref:AIPP2-like SPOC-like domain-containing protein n=1 Tax=Aristolochia fimbriata TaxID=158543 RepID=A0AAV7E7H2_ARIFI|nr:hypothetical protein H6P81_015909 [Aristolochia fimbriata]